MDWAQQHSRELLFGIIVVGATLVVANLAIGPDPLTSRIASVLVLGLVVPFLYFGMRWMLRLQIWRHGLRSWIIRVAALFFYFFGLGAIHQFVIAMVNIGEQTPLAVMFVGPAVLSYSSMDTIRRARAAVASSERVG